MAPRDLGFLSAGNRQGLSLLEKLPEAGGPPFDPPQKAGCPILALFSGARVGDHALHLCGLFGVSFANRQRLPLLEELPKLHSRARSLPQRFIHP